jgi:hypothetical protein
MRWRHLLFNNLWWKLLAFALAVMIWSGAQNVEVRELSSPLLPTAERTFHDLPIRILAPPGIPGPLHIQPPTARIDVVGDPPMVRRLGATDPLVFVELAGDFGPGTVTNRLDVRLPDGVSLIRVNPEYVVISAPIDE